MSCVNTLIVTVERPIATLVVTVERPIATLVVEINRGIKGDPGDTPDLSNYATKGFAIGMAIALG